MSLVSKETAEEEEEKQAKRKQEGKKDEKRRRKEEEEKEADEISMMRIRILQLWNSTMEEMVWLEAKNGNKNKPYGMN